MPTLHEAFLDYLSAKSYRSAKTGRTYRSAIERHLADWVSRPLDAIERREVEARLHPVVREEVELRRRTQVLLFLRECVGQPGESPHAHPHRQVVPLHVARVRLVEVGRALHHHDLHPGARRRAVLPLVMVRALAVLLDDLCEVHVAAERIVDCLPVGLEAIGG